MQKLNSKVALVTGGASGLGKAIAQRLSTSGARVVVSDVQRELGQAAAAESGFIFFEQDVSDEVRWDAVVQEIEEKLGGLDILVSNAGIVGSTEAFDPQSSRLADWKKISPSMLRESSWAAARRFPPCTGQAVAPSSICPPLPPWKPARRAPLTELARRRCGI